jgi:hypothetical protein
MPSTAQTFTEGQQSEPQMEKRKSKCHGNRKLQHFKRKCRARGLTEEQITTRIQNRNHTISEQLLTGQVIPEQQAHQSRKRKRDDQSLIQKSLNSSIKSMSQLSISQATVPKKTKLSPVEIMLSNSEINTQTSSQNDTLHKPSKYLKMPRRLLLHSLHLQLNCPLKKNKKEQRFVLSRLKLVDQQFCLEQIRYLYQTYFDLGLQQQVWPVSFSIITSIVMPIMASF